MAEDARTATIWGALCEHMMHCHCVSVSDSDMAEDARTAAIWGAPYALLFHDDSKTQALEYANQQVSMC